MSKLSQGRIIWIPVADPNGQNRYNRPVIILSSNNDIESASSLFGVVASRTAAKKEPLPEYCVLLPYQPEGRVRTKLKHKTAAVCTWVIEFEKSSIASENDIGGIVGPSLMALIIKRIRQFNSNK